MTTYNFWVGGDDYGSSTYCGETGAVRLTEEQIEKYITIDEDGISFDEELISNILNEYDEDDDTEFPTWSTITDGCLGWGAYTDQMIGVVEEDSEEPVFLEQVEELEEETEVSVDVDDELKYDQEGIWVVYHSAEKGGYGGSLDIEGEFDPSKLSVNMLRVADSYTVVNGISYDGEDVDLEGDTTGKSLEFFIYYNDCLYDV